MYSQLIKRHASWCPEVVCGGRPGTDALQTGLEIGLTFEESIILHKQCLLLIRLDLPKFFNSFVWGLIDGLAREFGMLDSLRESLS